MENNQPIKIVVEVVSHADVARLEARDEEIRKEIARIEGRLDGLHQTLYEMMEALGGLRKNR